ncbi:MAG TPA: hypothetical protein PK887_02845 [Ignavibacteriales bacterium]|nr:hypothetical protein [Ignavibacteriales bacterium]
MDNLFKKEHYELLLKAISSYKVILDVVSDDELAKNKLDDILDDLYSLHEKYGVDEDKLEDIQEEFEQMIEEYNTLNASLLIANEIAIGKMTKKYGKDLENITDEAVENEFMPLISEILKDINENGVQKYLNYDAK